MKYSRVFTSLVVILFIYSCTKDVGQNITLAPTKQPVSANSCDTVKFSAHILPIINSNCLSCHSGSGPGNGNFTSYSGIKQKVDNGSFKARVVDLLPSPMPQGGALPTQQIAIIKCWLDNGAPNN